MKKIVSLIVLVVLVASCSNDENDDLLYKEMQKLEEKGKQHEFAKDGDPSDVIVDTAAADTPPPPPMYDDPGEFCEVCPIDPPKGGTKP